MQLYNREPEEEKRDQVLMMVVVEWLSRRSHM